MNKVMMLVVAMGTSLFASVAMANEGGSASGGGAMAAAIAISVAAFGGAIAQGLTASAALNGIARNPASSDKVFVPMIIGLALIESLVLYAFVIAFMVK